VAEPRFSARADVDLADIALHIAETDASLALRIWDEVEEAASRLAAGEARGHHHPSIRDPELLVFRVRRWFLVYERDSDPLMIRRVVAVNRDLTSLRF
jgi:plasmid stabilization system protein ParE